MKKIFGTLGICLAFVLSFSYAAFFTSCSNSSSTPQIDYLARDALLHRAYTGGSLIYNPDNIYLSQLAKGVKIGVRTSILKRQSESLYQIASENDLREDKTINLPADGTWTGGSSETFQDYIYEVEGSEVYGYITVTSVGSTSISLVYCYYPNGSLFPTMQSFTIYLGGEQRLGTSNSIIKYTEPLVPRRGFENARWLTFVNSEQSMSACMYSRMPELNGKISSLYGVNSDNDFIYVIGNPSDLTSRYPLTEPTYERDKISYGDYIVDLGQSKMYAYVPKGSTSSSVSMSLADENNFNNVVTTYAYKKYQFPDPENGPKSLFEALPQTLRDQALAAIPLSKGSDGDSYVTRLNWILCYNKTLSSIEDYFLEKGDEDAALFAENVINDFFQSAEEQLESWQQGISDGTKSIEDFEKAYTRYIETVRYFMDEFYDLSPDAVIPPPTLFNIYPDVALDLGGGENQAAYNSANLVSASWDNEVSKSIGNVKNYQDYVQKRDEIINKFNEFHRLDLAAVNDVKLANVGFTVNFAFGVKGKVVKNLGIKSGELGIKGLGAAVFMRAEASLQNIDDGEHSFFDEDIRKKMEKELSSIKFAIGPIPCVFKTTFKYDFGWNAKVKTNVKYMAGITALYGGEIDLGAKWGVKFKWKIIPVGGYFKPWPTNARGITETAIFVGPAEGAPDVNAGLDLGIYAKGTLTPQVGVGVDYICAGVEVPATAQPEVHLIADTKYTDPPNNTPFHLKGLLKLSVGFGPFFEVTIPIIHKKLKTNWTAIKILDKGSESSAIELFDEPMKY